MGWHEQYAAMTDRDKEEFSRLVSLLFEQTFLVRDVWDPKEHRMVGNRDYRFAERNLELLKEYLAVSGFEIQADGRRGVIALYNKYERNRMKVDKFTTYLLYTLRLVYEEQMETASMRREVVVPLREIVGKLYTIGLLDKRVATTHLQSALNRLRKLSILARVEGSVDDMESRWMIYPTITVAVSDERINDLYERMLSGEFEEGVFSGEDHEDEDDEDQADQVDDDLSDQAVEDEAVEEGDPR
ncbi:MAG: DUF4194 domain-containing protein [Alicyclobacillus sp.]|nr:DUF4194 domain-containing protein [Alicyclobacillus sp.]